MGTHFTAAYISLNGEIIPNHGYVAIGDIGTTNGSALICHTNRPANGGNSGGDWYGPHGNRVSGIREYITVQGLVRNRAEMIVRMFKRTSGSSPKEGLYHCVIEDSHSSEHTIYVGLYNNGSDSGESHSTKPMMLNALNLYLQEL